MARFNTSNNAFVDNNKSIFDVVIVENNPSAAAVLNIKSTTTESSKVLKNNPGNLIGLAATTTTSGYIMLYDATSVPADGATTPLWCQPLYTAGTWGWITPLQFTTGIVVVFSTTGPFTKTASATATFYAQVQ
jgi:hypothetical protein